MWGPQQLPNFNSYMDILISYKAIFYDDTSEENCNIYSSTRSGFGYLAGFTLLILVFYIIVVICLIAKTHSRPFHVAIMTIFIGGDFIMMTLMASRKRLNSSCIMYRKAGIDLARQTVGTCALETCNGVLISIGAYLCCTWITTTTRASEDRSTIFVNLRCSYFHLLRLSCT
ncbi:hypothetical protein WR25_07158 [Diploscapter pachys]|uniref:Uncharacterized protein n=1 Tax=Diploscapter pachys TaxID=2018661 RepID=A0A2A2J2H9_9BILA|nr:hypothetical protein WR25_07158 [Diploscapter pachys]